MFRFLSGTKVRSLFFALVLLATVNANGEPMTFSYTFQGTQSAEQPYARGSILFGQVDGTIDPLDSNRVIINSFGRVSLWRPGFPLFDFAPIANNEFNSWPAGDTSVMTFDGSEINFRACPNGFTTEDFRNGTPLADCPFNLEGGFLVATVSPGDPTVGRATAADGSAGTVCAPPPFTVSGCRVTDRPLVGEWRLVLGDVIPIPALMTFSYTFQGTRSADQPYAPGSILFGQIDGTIDPLDPNRVIINSFGRVSLWRPGFPLFDFAHIANDEFNTWPAGGTPVMSFDGSEINFRACPNGFTTPDGSTGMDCPFALEGGFLVASETRLDPTVGLATAADGSAGTVCVPPPNAVSGCRVTDRPLVGEWSLVPGDVIPISAVEIDIKPGSDPNAINPIASAVVPVAILTTDDFDATQVDATTLAFGPDGAGIVHRQGHVVDIDKDGDADLVVHFKTKETGIKCGDTEATLTGATFGGEPIIGTDAVKTVGCAGACISPPPGLVSWWPGDGNALDIVGPNDGTPFNGATFAPGLVDQAFSFDGLDDVVGFSGFNIDDLQQLTIDTWVKLDSLPSGKIERFVTLQGEKAVLRHDGNSGPRQLHFFMTIGGVFRHVRVNDVLQVGVFHHVAGTYDGSVMRLYLDGVQVGSRMISGGVRAGSGGHLSSGVPESLDGLVDEVEIYDRALTASEIAAIFAAGGAGKCK